VLSRYLLPLVLALSACAPTLSKPRGKKHMDALAEAQTAQHHGRLDDAIAAYQRAAETAERKVDRDEALYRLSRVYARKGDLKSAIEVCDKLGDDKVVARRTLRGRLDASRYRIRSGTELERAENDLMDLMEDEPNSAAAQSALRILAVRHVDEVEDKEAGLVWIRDMKNKVLADTLGEPLMGAEAELLLQLGRKDEAKLVLQRQVVRYPYPKGRRWDDALWQLADLALEDENPKEAIQYLQQMVDAHEYSFVIASYTRPRMPKAALRIARIYRDDLRDPDKAIKAYENARSEFPRSTVIDDSLAEEAEIRIARGERDEGCDLYRELMENHEVGSARRRAETRIAAECGSSFAAKRDGDRDSDEERED
jgi:tetratricopeptide (TPR) repeat protein